MCSAPSIPCMGRGRPSVPPSELLSLTQRHRGRADLIAARGQDMIWLDIPVLSSSKVYLRRHGEDSPVSALQRGQLVAFMIYFWPCLQLLNRAGHRKRREQEIQEGFSCQNGVGTECQRTGRLGVRDLSVAQPLPRGDNNTGPVLILRG